MRRYLVPLLFLFASIVFTTAAPTPRLELLTRAPDHPRRRGASSLTGAPEISRDGNFILFLSRGRNLTTDPDSATMNLYMTDRRTHVTTLISSGLNGEPANDSILNYQFSADARKVLFETAASNLVPNDTNKVIDVFLKDLDANSTILISTKTAATPALSDLGGYNAVMTPDATFVAFESKGTFSTDDKDGFQQDIYVRDVRNNVTILASGFPSLSDSMDDTHFPAISDDGRFVAFQRDLYYITNGMYHNVFVRDLLQQTTTRPGSNFVGACNSWLLSHDGHLVLSNVSSNTAPTNFVVRYNAGSGAMDLISSNITSALQVLAASADASTIVMDRQVTREVWREGDTNRAFPTTVTGQSVALPFADWDLSLDGRYFVFVSQQTDLIDTNAPPGPQAFVCDLTTTNVFALLSPKNDDNGVKSYPIDPVISGDGSAIAYVSDSDGLVDSDSRVPNIHVWDRATGLSELVTTSIPGSFQNSSPSTLNVTKKSLSDDGKRLVYASIEFADPVTMTNRVWKVYVLDRTTGERQLVSYSADDPTGSKLQSFGGIISGDGNVVAYFGRSRTNFGALYLRALDTGIRQVAHTNLDATLWYPLDSPSLSHDGRFVAFLAFAGQPGLTTSFVGDIFLFDRLNDRRTLISSSYSYPDRGGIAPSANPLISPDGEYVVFQSQAWNLGVRGQGVWPVFIRQLSTGTLTVLSNVLGSDTAIHPMSFNRASTTLLFPSGTSNYYTFNFQTSEYALACTNCFEADMSEDGRYIAFSSPTPGNAKLKQIYLRDRLNDTQVLVSTNALPDQTTSLANGNSFAPHVTDDGRYVIFESRASNLVTNDNNNASDIFLYDTLTAQNQLISRTPDGASGNFASQRVALTADKSQAVFRSHASDLVLGDYNDAPDLFAFTIPGPDSDQDGLDDRWEFANFGDLSHDGAQDTDADGLSDLLEFAAGTSPSDSASVLRLKNVTLSADGLDLTWSGVPGRIYRIQGADSLDSSQWMDITAGWVAASTSNTAHISQNVGGLKFFRIVESDK